MGMYGRKYIYEGYIKNDKDIYYNKAKFDTGEINLCFITGHSGSGKSTMAHNMENKKGIETYELDDVMSNKLYFTMDNFKEYGDLIYSFFNGIGKKYYYIKEDIKSGKAKEVEDYNMSILKDFINFSKKYAKSHKNKKFVIEGIYLYSFSPEEFKDYAFYIKGTSALISTIRAAKRDSKEDKGINKIKGFVGRFLVLFKGPTVGFTSTVEAEKAIQKFRDYFSKLEKESNLNESYLLESNNQKLYFLSSQNMNNKTLRPRIPDNFLTKNNYEDNETKRVCFAPSINQCLIGLSMNCKDKEFYVHTPDNIDNYEVINPTKFQVPDCKITNEKWILEPVKIICIGKIKVIGDTGKEGHKYTYGDKLSAELYDWNYKWIEKY